MIDTDFTGSCEPNYHMITIMTAPKGNEGQELLYKYVLILHFTFLFSLFVFVSAAGHYFRIWTGQVNIIILDKEYNIANSSCHFGSYGSIRTEASVHIIFIW
jgi:hypothetical protein